MALHINWLAVALATLSSMIVGSVWYLPPLFGRPWMAATGIDPNDPPSKPAAYGGSLAASFVTALVLATIVGWVDRGAAGSAFGPAIAVAVLGWAGLTAARMLVHDLFQGRKPIAWAIDAGYELVTIGAMGVIIGAIGS